MARREGEGGKKGQEARPLGREGGRDWGCRGQEGERRGKRRVLERQGGRKRGRAGGRVGGSAFVSFAMLDFSSIAKMPLLFGCLNDAAK